MVRKLPGAGAPPRVPGGSAFGAAAAAAGHGAAPSPAPDARTTAAAWAPAPPEDLLLGVSFEELVRRRLRPVIATLAEGTAGGSIFREVLDQVERVLMGLALEFCGGNQQRAAGLLGISRNTLRTKWNSCAVVAAPQGNGRNGARARGEAQA